MEEKNLLYPLKKVEAPLGFEQRVMTVLALRKKKRMRSNALRFSLAGVLSVVLLVVIITGVFQPSSKWRVGPKSGQHSMMSRDFTRTLENDDGVIPVMEQMDYNRETSYRFGQQRPFIYLLEQVSDRSDTKIIY